MSINISIISYCFIFNFFRKYLINMHEHLKNIVALVFYKQALFTPCKLFIVTGLLISQVFIKVYFFAFPLAHRFCMQNSCESFLCVWYLWILIVNLQANSALTINITRRQTCEPIYFFFSKSTLTWLF